MKYNYLSVCAVMEAQNTSFVIGLIDAKLWLQDKVVSLCYQS